MSDRLALANAMGRQHRARQGRAGHLGHLRRHHVATLLFAALHHWPRYG